MRKINLNKATFTGAEVLSREELKKVMGGNVPGGIDWCGTLGWVTCDWTCNRTDMSIHLGQMTCDEAESACPFGNVSGGGCSGGAA